MATADKAEQLEEHEPAEGAHRIGPFHLVRRLGQTPFGPAYLVARQSQSGKLEVLEVLHISAKQSTIELETTVKRLQPLRNLGHDSLGRVVEVGQSDGRLWVATEHEPARNLAAFAKAHEKRFGPMLSQVCVHIAAEVLRALEYATDESIAPSLKCHGAVSPETVLITDSGRIRVTQFGLAPALGLELTAPGLKDLAVAKSSPAQIDILAVVALLRDYAMEGLRSEAQADANTPPPGPRLSGLVENALGPDPDKRPTSLPEVLEELEQVQSSLGGEIGNEDLAILMADLFGDELRRDAKEHIALLGCDKPEAAKQTSAEVRAGGLPRRGRGSGKMSKTEPLGPVFSGDLVEEEDGSTEDETDDSLELIMDPDSLIAERYRFIRELGEGGMGRVIEVEHLDLGRRLAMKILRPALSHDPLYAERFRREARAACKIGHRHIVDVMDFGRTEDGRLFYVMELLEGLSLGDMIDNVGILEQTRALGLVLQMCDALDAAHEQGVVHRDLKPDNLIITLGDGGAEIVRVVDFGIAQDQEAGSSRMTKTGQIVGTPPYMAPEQVRGRPTDARTDVYAAGAILYELVTGHRPFEAETVVEVMAAHLKKPVIPPRRRAPEEIIHPALDEITVKALAKKPEDRYQSMADLAFDLWAALEAIQNQGPQGLPEDQQDLAALTSALGRAASGRTSIGLGGIPSTAGTSRSSGPGAGSKSEHRPSGEAETVVQDALTSDLPKIPLEGTQERRTTKRIRTTQAVGGGIALVALTAIITVAVLQFVPSSPRATDGSVSSTRHPTKHAALNPHLVTPADGGTAKPDGAAFAGDGAVVQIDATRDGAVAESDGAVVQIDAAGDGAVANTRPDGGRSSSHGGGKGGHRHRVKRKNANQRELMSEANRLLRSGQAGAAESIYQRVLKSSPGNASALAGVGRAQFERGNHGAAVRYLSKAVTARPASISYRLQLAGALLRSGQRQAALDHYREVLERDPNNAVARRVLDKRR